MFRCKSVGLRPARVTNVGVRAAVPRQASTQAPFAASAPVQQQQAAPAASSGAGASAPPMPPTAGSAAASSGAAKPRAAAASAEASRDELVQRTLDLATASWPMKHDHLTRLGDEYANVLAMAQTVIPPPAGAAAAVSPTQPQQVGYWRAMTRMLLLRQAVSPSDLANPAPFLGLDYDSIAALEDAAADIAHAEGQGGQGGEALTREEAEAAAAREASMRTRLLAQLKAAGINPADAEAVGGLGAGPAEAPATAGAESDDAEFVGVTPSDVEAETAAWRASRAAEMRERGGGRAGEGLSGSELEGSATESGSELEGEGAGSGSEGEGAVAAGACSGSGSDLSEAEEGAAAATAGAAGAAGVAAQAQARAARRAEEAAAAAEAARRTIRPGTPLLTVIDRVTQQAQRSGAGARAAGRGGAAAAGGAAPRVSAAEAARSQGLGEAALAALRVDSSPPVTGALSHMRFAADLAAADASAGAGGAPAAAGVVPGPSALHPLATLWLSAVIRYLEATQGRLQGYLQAANVGTQGKAPLWPRPAFAAAGIDLAAAEAVVEALSVVPMRPLSGELVAWLQGLPTPSLELLLGQVALRRRGISAPGSITAAPPAAAASAAAAGAAGGLAASPLSQRVARLGHVLTVLRAAKDGHPLIASSAEGPGQVPMPAPHPLRYPTLRQLHGELLTATSTPTGAPDAADALGGRVGPAGAAAQPAVPVPGFSDRLSAAAARLAQYSAAVDGEVARLAAALAHASAAAERFGGLSPAVAAEAAEATTVSGGLTGAGSAARVSVSVPVPGREAAGATLLRALPAPHTSAAPRLAANGAAAAAAAGKGSHGAASAAVAEAEAAERGTLAAAAVVAGRLNEGHLPTLLQPLALLLSPAEWSGLLTTCLVAAPTRTGHIAHPPAVAGAVNAFGASTAAATPAGGASAAAASQEDALAQAVQGGLASRGVRALAALEGSSGSALEAALGELEGRLAAAAAPAAPAAGTTAAGAVATAAAGEGDRASVVGKLRSQLAFARKAAAAGAFSGREAGLVQVLQSLLAAAEEAAPAAAAALGKSGGKDAAAQRSAYFSDLPSLVQWWFERENAATPEGLTGRSGDMKSLDDSLAGASAVSELAWLCNDAAAAADAASGSVYSVLGGGSEGGAGASGLASLTQVLPLPLEAAAGISLLPTLHVGAGGAVSSSAPALATLAGAAAQPLVDPSQTHPLLALAPTPSLAAHTFYPSTRTRAVPRGDGGVTPVPAVAQLPPELTVTSVYGVTGAPNAPAATRVIDEWVAEQAAAEAAEAGRSPRVPVGITRYGTDSRVEEVSLLAGDGVVAHVVHAALAALRGVAYAGPVVGGVDPVGAQHVVLPPLTSDHPAAGNEAAGTSGAGRALAAGVRGGTHLVTVPADRAGATTAAAAASGSDSEGSSVELDIPRGPDGAGPTVSQTLQLLRDAVAAARAGGDAEGAAAAEAELAERLAALGYEAAGAATGSGAAGGSGGGGRLLPDVTSAEDGGVPVTPSTNPARTRAAKVEALVSAVVRTAKAAAIAAAGRNGGGGDGEGEGDGGDDLAVESQSYITSDLIRRVERALQTGTGVPVVQADGAVVLVDPRTGGLHMSEALQWREYEYSAGPGYRGPAPAKPVWQQTAAEVAADAAAVDAPPYGVVHCRIAEAMEARDLGAVWSLFTEHKRLHPQEGAPDFLLYEMVADACARAKRADLLFEVVWPEMNRLRMVATPNLHFILFKGAALAGDLPRARGLYELALQEGGGKVSRSWHTGMVTAALEGGDIDAGMAHFNTMQRCGHAADPHLYSLLLAKLAVAGRLEDAHHVWVALQKTPTLAVPRWLYTQLMVLFARSGNVTDALACEKRMQRRIDRKQLPEPLAFSALIDAYLAAGRVDDAFDVLCQLVGGTQDSSFAEREGVRFSKQKGVKAAPDVDTLTQLSVALQCRLGYAVKAKVAAANAGAVSVDGSDAEEAAEAEAEGEEQGEGYVARGVPDSVIEGLVACYSRPQAVPPVSDVFAATPTPAPATLGPAPVPAGLVAIPAPAVAGRAGPAQDAVLPAGLTRLFETGTELLDRVYADLIVACDAEVAMGERLRASTQERQYVRLVALAHARADALKKPRGLARSDGESDGGSDEGEEEEEARDRRRVRARMFQWMTRMDKAPGAVITEAEVEAFETSALDVALRTDPGYLALMRERGVIAQPAVSAEGYADADAAAAAGQQQRGGAAGAAAGDAGYEAELAAATADLPPEAPAAAPGRSRS